MQIAEANACESGPCLNGGICYVYGEYSYKCSCRIGYTGQRCESGNISSKLRNKFMKTSHKIIIIIIIKVIAKIIIIYSICRKQ